VLRTRFTELFGIEHPVMSAPMAMHSGGTLAAAVSAAGGLGSFGGVNTEGAGWVRAQIELVRASTDRPFGIGFITPFLTFTEALFDAAVEGRPDVIALSFADPAPWVGRAKDAGARVVCQVQTLGDADLAVEAGADVLVAQGTEAGGHTGTMSLLPLLSAVVDRHPDVPVLAAGGIGDGRTLAAALLAGADGAWLGTAFLATPEAVEIGDDHKQAIVSSDGGDTIFTRAYDIASGLPWPAGIGERVRRDSFTDEWSERESELRDRRTEVTPPKSLLYGQSAGFVRQIRPAADVVRSICEDAERILRARPGELIG
jgi:nitronate monooxygenase